MEGNFMRTKLHTKLRKYTESWIAPSIGLLWGFAEATLFFIVPDFYLGFVALFNWRRGLLSLMWSVAGAILGGAVMYILASKNSHAATELVLRVPLIGLDMVQTVSDQMSSQGLVSLVSGLFAGIPYKIYAIQAGSQNLPILSFLLMTIPARLARILPVTGIACIAGVALRKNVKQHTIVILSLYILLWVGIYLIYFFLII